MLAACVLGAVANAHSASGRYTLTWAIPVGPVYWVFHQEAGATFRDAVRHGPADWNAIGEPMQFSELANDATSEPACNQSVLPWNWGMIRHASIDGAGNTLGRTTPCNEDPFNPTRFTSFRIRFDSAENFYRGTGTPGGNQIDLWSVATHEFGHATGWLGPPNTHFDDNAPECTNPPKHTMCPSISFGQDFMRVPATHDVHTFQAAY